MLNFSRFQNLVLIVLSKGLNENDTARSDMGKNCDVLKLLFRAKSKCAMFEYFLVNYVHVIISIAYDISS